MADWLDDVVAPRESGGRPNIGWRNTDLTPWLQAGKTVYGFPDWPGLPGPEGVSTAAGLYGITKTNWKNLAPKLGVDDFSPASQRKVADEIMRTQGKAAWAASEPGYKSGLRQPTGGTPEGYYGDALHLTIRPERPEFPFAALDALLGGQPMGEAQPGADHPLSMLDSLLGQGPKAGGPATLPQPDGFIEPPGPVPNLIAEGGADLPPTEIRPLPGMPTPAAQTAPAASSDPNRLLNQLLGTIEPPALGQAPPPMPAPAQPPAAPERMLDSLLRQGGTALHALGAAPEGIAKGAADIGQATLGLGERAALGARNLFDPGRLGGEQEPILRADIPVEPGLRAAGGLADFATGGYAGHLMPPAASAARNVSRETSAAMPGLMASEQGAIRLPPALVRGVKDAGKGIEKVFSPSSVDAPSEAAEMLIRREVGTARRRTEQAEAQVSARGPLANPLAADMLEAAREPWRPLVQRYVPEFEAYVRSKQPGYNGPPLPKPALLRFLDFVETRSRGTTYAGPPELRPLADVLRKLYREREAAIAAEPSTSGASFVEDYYAHQYTDPGGVARSFAGGTGRQGSGRSLRERTIPTLSEAIDRGFTPVTLDPVDMTMRYVSNMDRYLAHNRIFRVGRDSGMIRFYARGHEPPDWMPLEGRLAEKAVATGGVPGALGLQAYAPEGFARVYNNSVALGFLHGELGGKAYTAALHTKNAITQSVLSLSGYHAVAMAQEAMASALSSGIEGLKAGDVRWGLKQLGLGAMPGVKAVKDVLDTGRKMERQYRGIQDYGPDFERVANLYAGAGGRVVGRGAEYQGTSADNYFKAFRKGHTLMEWKTGLKHVGEGNPLYAPARAVGFLARELARINETVTAPMFDKMVPRLKAAAFYDEMSSWLRQNPLAPYEEQLARARRIQETVDDRFGELVMDNLFWGRRAKQTLQLAATSLGWEHGSIRSIGGSAFDAVRGEFSPRVRYVIGLGAAIGIMNASYQYLKTGKTPGEGIGGLLSAGGALDLAMPRTGGTTPEGASERAMLPGFEKDIVGYAHDPVGELAGKLSPAGRLLGEFWSGRDYFGREIAPFPKYTPEWFRAYAGHVGTAMIPIPFRQEQLKGTNIPQWERFAGNRPAPERWQNPLRQEKLETSSHIRALRGQLAGLYAHGARTQQERKEINDKAKEIMAQIQKLQGDYQRHVREGQASKPLYFSVTPKDKRDLRPSTGGP